MRFASVYKDFQDPADFERELEDLGSLRKTTPQAPFQRQGEVARSPGSRVAGGGTHDREKTVVELAART